MSIFGIEVPSKQVKSIIDATFPGYRKRKVYIKATESVKFYDLNWSGGTRNMYKACSLDGQHSGSGSQMNQPAPWNNKFENLECPVTPGCAIVQGGFFCGKEQTLTIFVHPHDMPKLIAVRDTGLTLNHFA